MLIFVAMYVVHVFEKVSLDQRSCSTLSPVSTGMSNCLWAGKLSHYVTSHLGQLSLAIHDPSVDGCNEYWQWLWPLLGKKTVTFCITVAHATRTAGILTQLVKGAGC